MDHDGPWRAFAHAPSSPISSFWNLGNQPFGRRLSRGWSNFEKKNLSDAGKSNSNESAISTASRTSKSGLNFQNLGRLVTARKFPEHIPSSPYASPIFYPRSRPCAAPPDCSLAGSGCSASLPTPGSSERAPSHESAMPDVNTEIS